MKNQKISSRITASFVLVNTIYVIAILASLWSYSLSSNRLNNMNRTVVGPEMIVNDVQEAVLRERIALRQLALLDPGIGEYVAAREKLETEHKELMEAMVALRDGLLDDADKIAANEFLSYYENEYSPFVMEFISLSEDGNDSELMASLSDMAELETDMDGRIEYFTASFDKKIAFFLADAKLGFARLFIIAAIVVAIVMILVLCIIGYMKRLISRRVEKLSKTAELMSMGILDVDIKIDGGDEIGQLTNSFLSMVNNIKTQVEALVAIADSNLTVSVIPRCDSDIMGNAIEKMIDNLNNILGEVNIATEQVSVGASQIACGAQALSQGAIRQASTVEELSATIAQVLSQTKENSQNAYETLELVNQAGNEMQDTEKYMEELKETMSGISSSSEKISKVIKVIDDIAFQTNILALNAAVEAARAGQHGKGFAVVADEVRNLASKSAEAAKETAELVQSSVEYVQRGSGMADKTSQSVLQVADTARQAQEKIREINEASQRQEDAIAQINEGIEQISQVVQTNSATAEENAAASEELSGQSQILKQLVGRFRIKDSNRYSTFSSGFTHHSQLTDRPLETAFALSDSDEKYGMY